MIHQSQTLLLQGPVNAFAFASLLLTGVIIFGVYLQKSYSSFKKIVENSFVVKEGDAKHENDFLI